jgi:hypothetical protein
MTSLLITSSHLLDRRKRAMYSLLFALVIAGVPVPRGEQSGHLFKSHYEAVRQL